MGDIKSKIKNINPNVQALNINELTKETNNVYKTISALSNRAEKLSVLLKKELNRKLKEFEENVDTLEEILENKEQMQLSKFYERLPNSSVVVLNEYLNGELIITDEDKYIEKPKKNFK